MNWKVDDIVFCIVKSIGGAAVFVELEDGAAGNIVLSEVASGRIRNLREYVSINRRIVCKILKIHKDHVELSLRRVTSGERDVMMDSYKKERSLASVLKAVGEDAKEVILNIKSNCNLVEFFESARENPKIFEKFLGKVSAEKVARAFAEKAGKERRVEKKIKLTSDSSSGVEDIKKVLENSEGIHYLGNGVFSVSIGGKDFKSANSKLDLALTEISERAKKFGVVFELKSGK